VDEIAQDIVPQVSGDAGGVELAVLRESSVECATEQIAKRMGFRDAVGAWSAIPSFRDGQSILGTVCFFAT
jgi:hypothetical protein